MKINFVILSIFKVNKRQKQNFKGKYNQPMYTLMYCQSQNIKCNKLRWEKITSWLIMPHDHNFIYTTAHANFVTKF